jgi:hypothetical protein
MKHTHIYIFNVDIRYALHKLEYCYFTGNSDILLIFCMKNLI